MLVLVNECPLEKFIMGCGLLQGYPLGSFLFLIVVEDLIGLFYKVVQCITFVSYQATNGFNFDIQ